jgi:DNA-binding transcriptional LysR family regulator
MNDLNQIHYFAQIARTGSITAAAKQLGLPKSTVSRGLARLEARLGVRLLERTTRRVVLTEAGDLYLQHCRQALEEVEQADLVVSALRGTPRGCLRLGTPMMFGRSFLAPLLGEFLRRYPELTLRLTLFSEPINPVEGNLDLTIQAGPVRNSGLFIKHLGEARLGIYASPSYVEKHGMPDEPTDLHRHHCVTSGDTGEDVTWTIHRGSERAELRLQPRVSVIDSAIHQQLALDGVGIVIIPCWLASYDQSEGRLVRLLPMWDPDPVDVYAVYPSRLTLSPKVRVFLEFLVERLELS